MRAQVLLCQLYAVAMECRRSAFVRQNRRFYNRDVRARPQLGSDLEKGPRACLDLGYAPEFAIPEMPVQLEMAERKQRPLFSIRAVAKLGIVARQREVAYGVQPFRMDIGRVWPNISYHSGVSVCGMTCSMLDSSKLTISWCPWDWHTRLP
jgi:hypothetical protein